LVKIDSFRSGEIIIEGKRYNSDVIVFPHCVKSDWWRKNGHQVYPEDIEEAVREKPELLVLGVGEQEMMRVLPETKSYLEEQGIEFIIQSTGKACQTYNQFCSSRKVVGAFHLTC
jgi:hypothetical protein